MLELARILSEAQDKAAGEGRHVIAARAFCEVRKRGEGKRKKQ